MKKSYRRLTPIFVVTIILVAAMNVHAGSSENIPVVTPTNNPGVVPPQIKIQGKTYGDWGAIWWNWALGVPYDHNPLLDTTGDYGSQNQQGQVWFLAGTAPSMGAVVRQITIPSGKFIFFPLVTYENDYPCPDPNFQPAPGQTLEEFLTEGAQAMMEPWITDPTHNTLSASVDGVSLINLPKYRGTSGLTTLTADPTEVQYDSCIIGTTQPIPQPMVSDGYWIMHTPLQVGQHTIHFSVTQSGSTIIDVTYMVTIE